MTTLENNRVYYTVYTRENRAKVTVKSIGRVNQM
jgi:hypothetical protein